MPNEIKRNTKTDIFLQEIASFSFISNTNDFTTNALAYIGLQVFYIWLKADDNVQIESIYNLQILWGLFFNQPPIVYYKNQTHERWAVCIIFAFWTSFYAELQAPKQNSPTKWELRSVGGFLKSDGTTQQNPSKKESNIWKRLYGWNKRGLLSSGIVLLHENARPHSAGVAQRLLKKFWWEISVNPSHSTD